MLIMLQLVPVRTAEAILSLNAKYRVSQLGGTQAAGGRPRLHASVSPRIIFTRSSAQPNEHGSVD